METRLLLLLQSPESDVEPSHNHRDHIVVAGTQGEGSSHCSLHHRRRRHHREKGPLRKGKTVAESGNVAAAAVDVGEIDHSCRARVVAVVVVDPAGKTRIGGAAS